MRLNVSGPDELAGGKFPKDAAGLYRELSEAMVFPTHHPAFDRLLVADTGELWVRHPQTEPPWSEGLDYNPVPHYETAWDVFVLLSPWRLF